MIENEDNNFNSKAQIIDKKKENETLTPSNIKELNQLVQSLGWRLINVNRLDYYSNTIPIGAFCNAVAFILFGFQLCDIFKCDDFLNGVILIFGGLGQITTGILEFIKGRAFPCMVYFTYGLYCLSLFFIKINLFEGIDFIDKDLTPFYSAWMIISIPITISSIKINLFYILHTLLTTAFFVLEVFGNGFDEKKVKEAASGVILAISGFISLYIFLNQIINEAMKFPMLPAIPIKPDNEVDITQDYRGEIVLL
jgi:succinate-acetate transporter protein